MHTSLCPIVEHLALIPIRLTHRGASHYISFHPDIDFGQLFSFILKIRNYTGSLYMIAFFQFEIKLNQIKLIVMSCTLPAQHPNI